MERRQFIESSVMAGLAFTLAKCGVEAVVERPHLYVTIEKTGALRTLDEVRNAVKSGHAARLWNRILERTRQDLDVAPITPATPLPGRSPVMAEQENPDYVVCEAAGQRILRASLVHLITGEAGYLEIALRQIEALFDDRLWPRWMDQAHEGMGLPAGLRTGMLAKDVAFAFDWIYPSITSAKRREIVDGLDRRAIQPFLQSLELNAWWMEETNNWQTTIVGGLGIAGMALKGLHHHADMLVETAESVMGEYLSIYGEAGEFNESIAYANATERPVNFFGALRYAKQGVNRLAGSPFAETCRWMMYFTLPPGRLAAFGDGAVYARPWIKYVAAVAAATRDPLLQWYYLEHAQDTFDPLELLWYDDSLSPAAPGEELPLGRVFPAHGGCISSRTDWHSKRTPCVVYGKFGRESNHEHNDGGQLCIDGYGERLIIDPGSPSSYPADFFSDARWNYYNASVLGHNVLMFGDREMRRPDAADDHPPRGRLLSSAFDNQRGAYWQLDLTDLYDEVKSVRRTVIHLLPGIVVVLDEATLTTEQNISLRWHTHEAVSPDKGGRFQFEVGDARLTGLVIRIDGSCDLLGAHHRYEPPYDRGRAGDLLEQRHEPFLEAFTADKACRLLSLFDVSHITASGASWQKNDSQWIHETENRIIEVSVANTLRVRDTLRDLLWEVRL